MTEQEIEDNRAYIYGYYCGRIGSTRPMQERDYPVFAHGWKDAVGDAKENVVSFVHASTEPWAVMDIHNLTVGVIRPRMGMTLYYRTILNDGFSEEFYVWDSTKYPSSGKARGWFFHARR